MNLKNIIRNIISESDGTTNMGNKIPLDIYVAYSETKTRTKPPTIRKTIFLNIANLTKGDMSKLKTSYQATIPPRQRSDENKVYYMITADKPESFFMLPRFHDMWRYLEGTGKYLMPDLDSVKDEIMSGNLDEIKQVELKAQNAKYVNLFGKIMTNLKNPEIQEMLQSISRIGFNMNEDIYGSVRSPENVLRAYAVKEDATFVASRGGWRNFNRQIVRGATPIYLSVPNVSDRSIAKAEKQLNITKDKASELGQHVTDTFKQYTTDAISGFKIVSFYDVSDTRVYPNKDDLWTNEPGLVDNLKGVLNDFARNQLEVDKEEMDRLGIKSDVNKNEQFSKIFIRMLEKNPDTISDEELNKLKGMDIESDLTVHKLLDVYFRAVFDRGPNNNIKEAKIVASIVAVMTVEGVAEPVRLQLLKTHEDNVKNLLTDMTEWVSISLPVTNLIRVIGDNINENLNEDVSPEFIMGLFNVTPEMLDDNEDSPIEEYDMTTIREEFFRLFNKIKNE